MANIVEVKITEELSEYDIKTDNYKNFEQSLKEFLDKEEETKMISQIQISIPYNLSSFAKKFIKNINDIIISYKERYGNPNCKIYRGSYKSIGELFFFIFRNQDPMHKFKIRMYRKDKERILK